MYHLCWMRAERKISVNFDYVNVLLHVSCLSVSPSPLSLSHSLRILLHHNVWVVLSSVVLCRVVLCCKCRLVRLRWRMNGRNALRPYAILSRKCVPFGFIHRWISKFIFSPSRTHWVDSFSFQRCRMTKSICVSDSRLLERYHDSNRTASIDHIMTCRTCHSNFNMLSCRQEVERAPDKFRGKF